MKDFVTYVDDLVLAIHRERSWWHRIFDSTNCRSCMRIAVSAINALKAKA